MARRFWPARRHGAALYDVETRQRRGPLLPHPEPVSCVTFSPDGQYAVTGCEDGLVRFWHVAAGEMLEKTLTHHGELRALAFSSDGKLLLTGSEDRTARLWNVATGQAAAAPLPHAHGVNSVAISPDNKTLLTASQDGRGQLWDAATGKPIGPPVVQGAGLSVAGFSADGRTFLLARANGGSALCRCRRPWTATRSDWFSRSAVDGPGIERRWHRRRTGWPEMARAPPRLPMLRP